MSPKARDRVPVRAWSCPGGIKKSANGGPPSEPLSTSTTEAEYSLRATLNDHSSRPFAFWLPRS